MSMSYALSIVLVCLGMLPCMYGEQVFRALDLRDWHGWCARTKQLDMQSAPGTYLLKSQWGEISSIPFPVSATGTYHLSGEFRTPAQASELTGFYFGFVPLTADGKQIVSSSVCYEVGTETSLKDCIDLGDQIVEIVPPKKDWRKSGHVAFEISRDLSDIPNLSAMAYTHIDKLSDRWVLHLKKPAAKNYPLGVSVRQHAANTAYLYASACLAPAPRQWTRFTGTVSGIRKQGVSSSQWWYGTKRAAVLIMKIKGHLEFRNIEVTYCPEETK